MKLICQGNELSDALAKVVKALPIKRNNPILDGVKLTALGDTLTIFATDLELAIEKKINAQVLIEGEIVVPGKLFADYAKKIEEEQVELDGTDSSKLVIKYLDSELQIKCMSADEYPVFKEVDTQNSFIILKKEFKDIISKVIFNVAVDEARPSLRGVCLNVKDEEVEAVASDGYRLALAKAQIKNNGVIDKIIVPAKSMNELARLIDDGEESPCTLRKTISWLTFSTPRSSQDLSARIISTTKRLSPVCLQPKLPSTKSSLKTQSTVCRSSTARKRNLT